MTEHNVNIKVPNSSEKANHLTLKGLRVHIDSCKAALAKRLEELDADKADRALRSFSVELEVAARHHRTLIGKAGANITKLREELGVQFDFPKRDKDGNAVGPDNIIKITGYEDKVLNAQKVLQEKVDVLEKMASKDIDVDHRAHARIIGGKGAGIKNLQEKFSVRVTFPKDKDSNIINITGAPEDVEDAAEEILALAEEYMEEIVEREEYNKSRGVAAPAKTQASAASSEFKLRDAPWSNDESSFPSLASAAKPTKSLQGAWARR